MERIKHGCWLLDTSVRGIFTFYSCVPFGLEFSSVMMATRKEEPSGDISTSVFLSGIQWQQLAASSWKEPKLFDILCKMRGQKTSTFL
jgi:hypothetical protein